MSRTTGRAGQFGIAEESTYGTFVAPTVFVPFESESMVKDENRIESTSIRAGRTILDTDDSARGGRDIGGDVTFVARKFDIGKFFKHALGGVATAADTPSSGVYRHTFTPADLYGKSLSVQIGKPDATGTVRAFSYTGCKVNSLRLGVSEGEFAMMTASFIGQDETTGESLGSASYTASNAGWTFVHGALTIDSTAYPFTRAEWRIENGLERRPRSGSAVTTEPRPGNSLTDISMTADVDFGGLTLHNLVAATTPVTTVMTLTNGAAILRITGTMRPDMSTPTVDGVGEVMQPVVLKAVGTTDPLACTVQYETTQATP